MFLTHAISIPDTSPIRFPEFGIEINPNVAVFANAQGILGNIRWYGLVIALGFMLAVIYANIRKKQFGLTEDNIITMLLFAVPSAIICARAYYCIFQWEAFRDNPISCLYIWEGGIAIYGAVIGAVVAAWLYCKYAKISFGAMADIGGLGLFIGQSAGRWGNFFNREAFGAATDSPLRMGLQHWDGSWGYYHPTFLYESVWNIIGFTVLHFLSQKRKYDGEVFTLYVAWYGLGRFFIEGLRTDSLYLFGTGIRVSQMLALVSFVVAIGFFVYKRFVKKADGSALYVNSVHQNEK